MSQLFIFDIKKIIFFPKTFGLKIRFLTKKHIFFSRILNFAEKSFDHNLYFWLKKYFARFLTILYFSQVFLIVVDFRYFLTKNIFTTISTFPEKIDPNL